MTWPAWGDVLPALALLVGLAGSIAGAFWALMRRFQPVADRAARDAVDGLYDRLKANDFKHVEDGLRALGDRIDRMREDFGGRLDRSDNRLKDGLEDENYSIAMEVLAEAATQDVFTPAARIRLGEVYAKVLDNVPGRISDTLEVLVHDGYLEAGESGFRFPSLLLKDWWSARFRDHHAPLLDRPADERSEGSLR